MKKYHITFRDYNWIAYSVFVKASCEDSAMHDAFLRFDAMYNNDITHLSNECDIYVKCVSK